jgi:TonB family protein
MANPVSSIASEGLAGSAKAVVTDAHHFGVSVQAAIGPKSLDGKGLQGRVLVAFSLATDGSLQELRITQSSGHRELDSQVLELVGRAAFPTPPSNLTSSHRTFLSAFTFG